MGNFGLRTADPGRLDRRRDGVLTIRNAAGSGGEGSAALRERIDTAYYNVYGSSASSSMVTATAATTTLRLSPEVEIET